MLTSPAPPVEAAAAAPAPAAGEVVDQAGASVATAATTTGGAAADSTNQGAGAFKLPEFATRVEASLWEFADQTSLPDEQLDILAVVLENLKGREAVDPLDPLLVEFRGVYARLKVWAGRGRMDKMQQVFEKLLANVPKE
jgi:hypothetical protein